MVSKSHEPIATQRDIEHAVAYIQQSVNAQLEQLLLIIDGATLAVEQVQDKRLESVEKGKEMTLKDVIFDIFILYCWEVGVIGHIVTPLVKEATKTICHRLLKTRAIYNRLPKSDYGAQIIATAKKEKESKQVIQEIIVDHISRPKKFASEDFALFSKEVIQSVHAFPGKIGKGLKDKLSLDQTKQLIKLYEQVSKKKKPSDTDTPSVAVLGVAQSYAARFRRTLLEQQTHIISILRSSSGLTKSDVAGFISLFDWSELPDHDYIKDQYKLFFEAMIWAKLYPMPQNFKVHLKI